MAIGRTLIGRDELRLELRRIFAELAGGRGGLVLLAGESGVGKTRLAIDAFDQSGLLVLAVTAGAATASPFGPLVSAIRAFLRLVPDGLPLNDRLGRFLPILLPELGPPPGDVDRTTLFELIRGAFISLAQHQPTVIFVDDLHEADHATLELLPYLATGLGEVPLLLLGAYRTDGLRRDHPMRRLRAELRHVGQLRELRVEPLGPTETAELAAGILGGPVSPALAAMLTQSTDGLPLFVEELLAALATAGRLRDTGGVWQLADSAELLPIPETIRDVVLLRASRLGETARAALEVAAVAGTQFDPDLVTTLTGGEDVLGEAFAQGLLIEAGAGAATFRHALIRDALYSDIGWPRRRALHRQVAEQLERCGAASSLVAEHWQAGHDPGRARQALLRAADAACQVHAYRDAAGLLQRAVELWPEGDLELERLATLDRLGQCAQLSGDLATAASAWRELASAHQAGGAPGPFAETERRLAGVYELQGAWEQALAARRASADGFAASGQPGEAAAERLAVAAHLRSAASFAAALQQLDLAAVEARRAGRIDLQARILGLEGDVRARVGQYEAGVEQVRSGLALALEHNLSGPAAEVYQRLADALEHTGDYHAARQTYVEAADFCEAQGAELTGQLCRACMTVVLRQTGEWDRCAQVCAEVLASSVTSPHARAVVLGTLGLVRAQRGEGQRARSLLLEAAHTAAQIELTAMELLSAWGLAVVDELAGNVDEAVERCRGLLERWRRTEERHYTIPALRWAATLFAARRQEADARACANALAQIVAETGAAEAVVALGHVLGELSMLDASPAAAARHFAEALERLGPLHLPYERAQTCLRAGQALVAAGERDPGIQQLVSSYRIAASLGARPLAAAAAQELAQLGEAVDGRVGRRVAGRLERGGLTRRELEVMHLVADGQTDRQIARTLVLSPRTVEMHVANCLGKLGCRSRAEAVRRAAELELVGTLEPSRKARTFGAKTP
jgi:DNA-binding NarL/FixJ family response regulator